MQLFKVIWVFVLELADYPARLGSQFSSSLSYQNPLSTLKDQYNLSPAAKSCFNSPDRRDCWYGDYNIHTDYEKRVPHTGVTNYYTLVITNAPWQGDGYRLDSMLINGSYPGPTIRGDWGDNFEITVHNHLSNDNGTSIHWHGLRQLHTNYADGVSGVTQCPIPPNDTMVYKWRALQYGTSWYHRQVPRSSVCRSGDSDGVAGAIHIHGPTSANYDVDLGPLLITDWYHEDAFSLMHIEVTTPPVPAAESKLMNGTYGFFKCRADDKDCDKNYDPAKASTYQVNFVKGKKYKWGIVNTSAAAQFTFWIDGHNFTVVQTDFVPIAPYETNVVNIGIGQRYDIIVEANANTSNETDFWINMRTCHPLATNEPPYTGIIRYNPASTIEPSRTFLDPGSFNCLDQPAERLVPIVPRIIANVPAFKSTNSLYVANYNLSRDGAQVFNWELTNNTLYIDWEDPSLSYIGLNDSATKPFPVDYAPLFIDGADDDWVFFVIEGLYNTSRIPHGHPIPIAHPLHLHGHDFVILAQSTTKFDPNNYTVNTKNPARRDVAMLPANGYLIIGFQTDNPGVWLMHCHIAWHASAGLALQFVEREREIKQFVGKSVVREYEDRCRAWAAWYKRSPAKQADAGI